MAARGTRVEMPMKRARSSLSRTASVTAPKRVRSKSESSASTTMRTHQLSRNIAAGLNSTDWDTPNSVEGHSMFMPSAPPLAPLERDEACPEQDDKDGPLGGQHLHLQQDANAIAGSPEIQGMTKTDHAVLAQQHSDATGKKSVDDGLCEQAQHGTGTDQE